MSCVAPPGQGYGGPHLQAPGATSCQCVRFGLAWHLVPAGAEPWHVHVQLVRVCGDDVFRQ